MRKNFLAVFNLILLFAADLFSQQNSSNLKLSAQVNPAPGVTFSEVTGCGDLAIIGSFNNNSSVWIYDLTNKTNPVQLAAIPAERRTLDVQVHGRYLFISFDNGMKWYDILNPRQPKLVYDFKPNPSINAHTSFVAGNTLYIADQISDGVRIFDITNKKNPKPLADFPDPGWTIHDMTVIRGRMYAAWIFGPTGGELMLADVSNPAQPRELAKVRYPQAGTHSAWPTEDGQFILSTDEVNSTPHDLKIWDARTLGQLTQVQNFGVGVSPASTIHNVYVRGRYAYMSYYCEGVRIVDIADPFNPKQVAFYDLNGSASCFSTGSNWGVDPFSNLIYASDRQNGLYVLEFIDHPPANLAGNVVDALTNAPVAGAMVYFLDEYPTSRTNAAGRFDIPWFKNDTVRVVAEAAGYHSDTSSVITTANGKTTPTIRLRPLTTQVEAPAEIPNDFALLANYPNPVSLAQAMQTQIVFRLPYQENVRFEIFNMLGQRVRTLLNAPREAGEHTVLWNGTDNAGQRVAPGVYILQMKAGKFVAVKRITLLQ